MNIEPKCALAPPARIRSKTFHLQIQAGLGIALLTCLTGCVGYVDGGYDAGVVVPVPAVVVVGPEVGFYGGYYHGRDERGFSHRGAESRGGGRGGRH